MSTAAELVDNLLDGLPPTDIGNADRLVAFANGRIRWVDTWGSWIVYDETAGRWVIDTNRARVTEMAKNAIVDPLRNVTATKELSDPYVAFKNLTAWIKASSSRNKVEAMVQLARGVPGMIIDHNEIDAKPYLINVENGTYNAETGELQPHNPDDLLMLQMPVRYNPDARSGLWDKCVATWQPDAEVRAYLQRITGTGIIGHPVQALFVNVGNGANGKSVYFEAVSRVLGDFKIEPDKALLTTTKHEGHPTQVASLFGARMAVAAETLDGDRLNEASIKNLTGGDRLRARRMREDFWSFLPTHTMFLHTNHRPDIRGTDEGIWRRVRLIPWSVTIDKAARDEHLLSKLLTDEGKSAILNWLISGCADYLQNGTAEPDIILQATEAYRFDEDVFGRFVAARCVLERRAFTTVTDITFALADYCREIFEDSITVKEVAKRLTDLGCKPDRNKVARGWRGIRIIAGQGTNDDTNDSTSAYHHREVSVEGKPEHASFVSFLPSDQGERDLQTILADLQTNHSDVMARAARGEINEDTE